MPRTCTTRRRRTRSGTRGAPKQQKWDGTASGLKVDSVSASGPAMTITTKGGSSMASIVGTWNIVGVSWGGGPVLKAGPFTFNANGTWTYAFGGGRWAQIGDMVFWNFTNAAGLVYTANTQAASMTGIMGYLRRRHQRQLLRAALGPAAGAGRGGPGCGCRRRHRHPCARGRRRPPGGPGQLVTRYAVCGRPFEGAAATAQSLVGGEDVRWRWDHALAGLSDSANGAEGLLQTPRSNPYAPLAGGWLGAPSSGSVR